MKYNHYIWKRRVENIFIFPFIVVGRLLAYLKPLEKEYDIFFFFPFYHTGGAEKVHSLIVQAAQHKRCIIYFTRHSADNTFLNDFKVTGSKIELIAPSTDNKWLYFLNLIYRGKISGYINAQKTSPIVFNGQCNFGYKISPWINKQIPQIELIHSFNTFSFIRIPFLPFIKTTIMISQVRIQDHLKHYDKIEAPPLYKERIKLIVNGIPIPKYASVKQLTGKLKILYVGRGTEEKRVHLVAAIAEQIFKQNLPAEVMMMGDVEASIPNHQLQYCKLLGQRSDKSEIEKIYKEAHVLLITSSTEGFPMVIEEAMADGCAIMATPVGDIPHHIKPENGCVFTTSENEQLIIQEGVAFTTLLCQQPTMLSKMSASNIEYAKNHFSLERFNEAYQQLFSNAYNANSKVSSS